MATSDAPARRRKRHTSWADLTEQLDGSPGGYEQAAHLDELARCLLDARATGIPESGFFVVGPDDDRTAPLVLKATWLPGTTAPVHTHDTDYAEIILSGSQLVGRTWHHAGDIRVVPAGTSYGPLTAGPEGVTFLAIFRSGEWHPRGRGLPTFATADAPTDAGG